MMKISLLSMSVMSVPRPEAAPAAISRDQMWAGRVGVLASLVLAIVVVAMVA
jgi:hypothetical protein